MGRRFGAVLLAGCIVGARKSEPERSDVPAWHVLLDLGQPELFGKKGAAARSTRSGPSFAKGRRMRPS